MQNPVVDNRQKQWEQQLLIRCSKVPRHHESGDEVRDLCAYGLDWSYVVEQAQNHRVTALLYSNIKNIAPENIPNEVLLLLHDCAVRATQTNLSLTAELLKLLQLFKESSIPAVPYKGPVLSAQAYGGIVYRQFGDIDILVPQEDFSRARTILSKQGYAPFYQHEPAEERRYLQTSHDYRFVHRDTRLVVELQWGITSRSLIFPFNYWRATERLEQVTLMGRAVPSIAVEPLLFILCLHGAKHSWERLIWICDIAELIRAHPQLNWHWLLNYTKHLGGQRILFLGLFLAHTILAAELPEWVLREIQSDANVQMLARHVEGWLFHSENDTRGIMGNRRLFYMSLLERGPDRLQLALYYIRETRHPLNALRRFGLTSLRRLIDW